MTVFFSSGHFSHNVKSIPAANQVFRSNTETVKSISDTCSFIALRATNEHFVLFSSNFIDHS